MRISISDKTLENVANYLATKPYREVVQLMASIQSDMKPIPETEEEQRVVDNIQKPQEPEMKVVPIAKPKSV